MRDIFMVQASNNLPARFPLWILDDVNVSVQLLLFVQYPLQTF